MSAEAVTRLTFELLDPATAARAARALEGVEGAAALEGLCDLLLDPHGASAASAAVAALAPRAAEPPALEALTAALSNPSLAVRQAAVEVLARALGDDPPVEVLDAWKARVAVDRARKVRQAALRALAGVGAEVESALLALGDPHWRVRQTALELLTPRAATDEALQRRLLALCAEARWPSAGAASYLLTRLGVEHPEPAPPVAAPTPPWWDDDPAVLRQHVQDMGIEALAADARWLPGLLDHEDASTRRLAVRALTRPEVGPEIHRACLALLEEPRLPFAVDEVEVLLGRFNHDKREALARVVLADPEAGPVALAWALAQVGAVFPAGDREQRRARGLLSHRSPAVRAAALRALLTFEEDELCRRLMVLAFEDFIPEVVEVALAAGEWLTIGMIQQVCARKDAPPSVRRAAWAAAASSPGSFSPELWAQAAADPDPLVRLQAARARVALGLDPGALADDPDRRVRAEALTREWAEALWEDPSAETSWRVLARAASMVRRRLSLLTPPPLPVSERVAVVEPGPLPAPPPDPRRRRLGRGGLEVSPLGVSGHYGMPSEGYREAIDAGVNLFFWEPGYEPMNRCFQALPAGLKADVNVIAGTFEADPERARRDMERALRALQIDALGIFLVFWTRSPGRASERLARALEDARAEGLIRAWGLSTHNRALAAQTLEQGWNPMMVRLSAAHRKVEDEVLPVARRLEAGIITFNALAHGRMLRPLPDVPPPTPAECYRYCLSQPGVHAVLSAPRTLEELRHNLGVMDRPTLDAERIEAMRRFGARLYAQEAAFNRLVR